MSSAMTTERILALDVGDVRIGMALSDPTGTIAQPLETYTRVSRNADLAYIGNVIREKGVQLVVSGLPRLLDGTEGEQAAKTRAFIARGQRAWGVEVVFWDERLSTSAARGVLLDAGVSRKDTKAHIDKLAATVILQNYLDARANGAQTLS
jgi:putative Holliday junction resolvase